MQVAPEQISSEVLQSTPTPSHLAVVLANNPGCGSPLPSEGPGAADAGLMQIEWREEEVLKLAGVGTETEKEVGGGCGSRSR